MAYIQPNSIIQLFQGINLDNRYMHTIYFSSVNAQDSWFANRVTISFQAQSYTRYTRNQVKVQCDVTSILGCTYMRFLNDRAGDKWFYAFIISAEYINENTALITYEIDVMQTWFIGGGSIRPCMVLREHVSNDTFAANLESEPIGSEEYDCDLMGKFDDVFYKNGQQDNTLIVKTTGRPLAGACIVNGLFDGCKIATLPANTNASDSADIMDYLDGLLGSWDAGQQEQDIVDMYTVPTPIAEQGLDTWTSFVKTLTRPTSYDNYTPKNNKLFMYPYSYLLCTTHNGDSGMYRWEYFDHRDIANGIVFNAIGTCLGGGQIIAFPREYNGQEDNIDSCVSITDFPKNAFNFDAYEAWSAAGGRTKLQNEEELTKMRGTSAVLGEVISDIKTGIGAASGTAGLATGTANPSVIGNVLSAPIQMVKNTYDTQAYLKEAQNKIDYEWKDARYRPNVNVGASTPALAMGNKFINYYFYHVHVRDDEVKRLDDFLSCYGYAVNRVKQPNLTGRAYWNFVKTKDAVIAGAMPASAKEAIGRIFDGGITFWHNGDQIGNYMQSVTDGTINNPIV